MGVKVIKSRLGLNLTPFRVVGATFAMAAAAVSAA